MERGILLAVVVCSLSTIATAVSAQDKSRPRLRIDQLVRERSFAAPTYLDTLHPEELTTFAFSRDSSQEPVLSIDSSGKRVFFPLERAPRRFADANALRTFMIDNFGVDGASPSKSVSGRYVWNGAAFFHDPHPGITYRVTDPILAKLGGARGQIVVAGKIVCVDPDGVCDRGYASYLEPVGQTTSPTHLSHCGRFIEGVPVCVAHHAFYNKTWFFVTYVRHGGNSRFTNWASVPSSQLFIDMSIVDPSSPFFGTSIIDFDGAVGQDSHEVAFYCWGGCPGFAENSNAICTSHQVIDPDLTGTRGLGNGPNNNPSSSRCPGL